MSDLTPAQKRAQSRSRNARARIWAEVQQTIAANRCRCDLREDATYEELVALGGGCTMPSYGCTALVKFRRAIEPNSTQED